MLVKEAPGSLIHLFICGSFYQQGLILVPAWTSTYIHYKVRYGITNQFLNFNGATVEV